MAPIAVAPMDGHNRRLVSQVHPPEWSNPVARGRYHLVALGGGTAGLVAAAGAAGLGGTTALVEQHLMGGDCLNVGCVPSKALIAAARSWEAARRAAVDFGGPAVSGEGDFGAVMDRLRRLRADLSPIDGAERFSRLGVDVFLGRGAFTGPDTVEVAGATLRFRRAVIATGARAVAPPIPGLAESGYLTNESVFSLTELPRRLVVIGGGPIGCELAQAFAQLGSRVTLVDQADRVLGRDDPDAADIVRRSMVESGVQFVFGVTVEGVAVRDEGRILTLSRDRVSFELMADQILVAAGRAPNIDGIGLERAGVAFDHRGVSVDDRLRTSNPKIYAAGDVCSSLQFTHHADFQARAVLANALFFGRQKESRLVVPWCTYTTPELAQVGLSADAAIGRGHSVDVITVPFAEVDRAVLDGEPEGFLRVVVAKGTDRILGVTVVASHAGEMIGEAAVAMTNQLGLGAIGKAIHPYPTQAESFRKAADQWRRGKLTPLTRRLLATWFRVFS